MNTHKSRSFRLGRGSTKSNQPVEIGKNAARERSRVKSLRLAFQRLQSSLPTVPPDTKLSKLDVLILATNYISYLSNLLAESSQQSANESEIIIESKESQKEVGPKALHPIKKWPMRSRLYAGSKPNCSPSSVNNSISDSQDFSDNSFLLENIEPLLTEEWNPIDFDLLYDDLNSLSSFPNFSGTNH